MKHNYVKEALAKKDKFNYPQKKTFEFDNGTVIRCRNRTHAKSLLKAIQKGKMSKGF